MFDFEEEFGGMVGDVVAGVEDGDFERMVARLGPQQDTDAAGRPASASALADLPAEQAASSSGALDVRGWAASRLLLDVMGPEGAAGLVRGLRDRIVFEAEDVAAVGAQHGMPPLGDWFDNAALPGLVASPAVVTRLDEGGGARPRYHVSVHVRNDEAAPGWWRLAGHWRYFPVGDPVRVPGRSSVGFGVVMGERPTELWLWSYAAHNRRPVQLVVRNGSVDVTGDEVPFVGSRPSERTPRDEGIVVDDLAAELQVEVPDDDWWRKEPGTVGWTRQWVPSSWGKYRRTVVYAPPGNGDRSVVFAARLPSAGRWRLDYHMPKFSAGHGLVTMGVGPRGGEAAVVFDAAGAPPGWNHVGDYDLGAGVVHVTVSDRTTGTLVVADAIRWQLVRGEYATASS